MVHTIERNRAGKPRERSIIVANGQGLVGKARPRWEHIIDLARDVERSLPVTVALGVAGKLDHHLEEAFVLGRPGREIVLARGKLLRGGPIIVGEKPARPVHHQSGVGRDAAVHRLVAVVRVAGVLLHRDACAKGTLPVRACRA